MHELPAAGVPTVFVSNIRGTDDQETRARWCADHGCALIANQADLADIESTVRKLHDLSVRKSLTEKCLTLPKTNGAKEIADFLLHIHPSQNMRQTTSSTKISILSLLTKIASGPVTAVKNLTVFFLEKIGLSYRALFPHLVDALEVTGQPIFSESANVDELRAFVKAPRRFEHLIAEPSERYRITRKEIATKAYDL